MEQLKLKTLKHVLERYPKYSDDLQVFLQPHTWHLKFPPVCQIDISHSAEGTNNEAVVTTQLMPQIPVFKESSKAAVFKLCCEVMMMAGQIYASLQGCARSTGMVTDCAAVMDKLPGLDKDYGADTNPYRERSFHLSPEAKQAAGSAMKSNDLPDFDVEDIERLENDWEESKVTYLDSCTQAEMRNRGSLESILFTMDEPAMTRRLQHHQLLTLKLSGQGQGMLYFYDLKQLVAKTPHRRSSRMNMVVTANKERLEFFVHEIFMRHSMDDDIGVIMCGKNEVAFRKILHLLQNVKPNVHVRVQNWLYAEDALRTSGLQRARYMCGLAPREYSLLFSKSPIQCPLPH